MKPFEQLRLLEIGEAPYVKRIFPEQTDFFSTSPRQDPEASGQARLSIGISDLRRKLEPGAVDLVVYQPQTYAPWHPLALTRMIFNRRNFSARFTPQRPFGPVLLRLLRQTPLAVLDLGDFPYIDTGKLHLLDRATLYFKRELPADEWKLLTGAATPKQPSPRFRRRSHFGPLLTKLRPISLGLPLGAASFPEQPVAKTADVFFSGMTEGMPVRQRALQELHALEREGVVVDIPRERIPQVEFYRRCAAAWLTLSPEGLGWDCFRHYEAAACGSVPLMNTPGIVRHAPFTDGVDALFYSPEPGALTAAIRKALGDKDALRRMALAAAAHVERHHTSKTILRYAVEETLAARA